MDNQNKNSEQVRIPENMRVRKKLWVMVVAFVLFILLIGAVFVWNNYLSPLAQKRIEIEKNYEKTTSAINAFEEAMRADTYGGKTPQETLNMFIDALKKGDVTLASRYFMLDTDTKSPDYLTRKKWEDGLNEISKNSNISNLINLLENAKSDPEAALNKEYFVFSVRDNKGIVTNDIDLELNKYSQVWKIESM